MSKNFKQFSKAIWENYEVVEEENKPTNPELWSRAKSMAKKKFDVYPSAYANGWAAKWYKSKGGGWRSVSEEIEPEKKDEYDGEVDMAKNQLRRIISHAQHFHDMLTDKDQNLPEWVQSKVTKAEDYISTAHDYMMGEMQEETISESLGNHGALTNYANSSKAGIDKKDFHTAAKHMKSGHLNKLKTHLANMDTDPRDHVIKHIDKKHHKALGYHMSEATYTAVHAKHGKKTVQADSTYGAAKAAASHWNTGKKGTQGIDVHLHTDKPQAYTEAVVRLDPKSFLKVKGPSSAYDAGYTAAKSGKKYGENPKNIKSKVLRERNFQMRESGWTVQRVTAQTEFGWHSDEGEQYGHTFILYLNDIDIEDGGATEFAYGRKVQPKAGKLLIFPGGWSNVHRGCFVRKPKYMITNNSNFYYPRRFPFITS